MIKTAIAIALSLTALSGANAMTIVASSNGPDSGIPAGQRSITNFDTAAGLSGNYILATNSLDGQYAAPYLDNTQYLAVLGGQTATLAISPAVKSLSFYWGSIDDFNTVSFFSGGSLVQAFTGSQIPAAPADGSQGNPLNNRRVTFDFGGAKIDSVSFASTQNSFELDTVAGAVPEPTTWAMLILGMGLVGVSMRRRKPVSVAA